MMCLNPYYDLFVFIKSLKKLFDFSQGFSTKFTGFKGIFKKSQGFAPTKLGRSGSM